MAKIEKTVCSRRLRSGHRWHIRTVKNGGELHMYFKTQRAARKAVRKLRRLGLTQ